LPIDRDDTIRKADKLLRQGRLDAAIAEYEALVEAYRRDWTAANALGDLYVRAGRLQRASIEFVRIADHFLTEGFFSKASALYKKALKVAPDAETALERLAEASAAQGLVVEARRHLRTIIERRRARGDQPGADEMVVQLARLEPDNRHLQAEAGQALMRAGRAADGAALLRRLAESTAEEGRHGDALVLLEEILRRCPDDRETLVALLTVAVAAGDWSAAHRALTDRQVPDDAEILELALQVAARNGAGAEAERLVARLLDARPDRRTALRDLCLHRAADAETLFAGLGPIVARAVADARFAEAIETLEAGLGRFPDFVPALLQLVDAAVDGAAPQIAALAQRRLADVHLAEGRFDEARTVAEDLVLRHPADEADRARLRRVLVAAGETEPNAVIAQRLSLSADLPVEGDDLVAIDPLAAQPAAAASTTDEPTGAPLAAGQAHRSPVPAGVDIDLTGVLNDLTVGASLVPLPARLPGEDSDADLESAQLQVTLARAYLDAGQPVEAEQALAPALEHPGTRDEAAFTLGEIEAARGDAEQAIVRFEQVLAHGSAPPGLANRARYALGSVLAARGESSRALVVWLELLGEAGDYLDTRERVAALSRPDAGG
jgi:tetratricopeptide (TPR) repeat protein